ncbi:MAG: hypothetical protein OSJ43_06410 [Oscillospiraceae bacterium]|nr:hypothetical protein [Oscillospiraceae bacterium]
MYILIKARLASMEELKTCYTLDEALNLWVLFQMENDIQAAKAEELSREMKR